MTKFPRREAETIALADLMIGGFTGNPAEFPNCDVPGLQALRADYQAKRADQLDADAKARLATELKEAAFRALEAGMRTRLRQSEVDCAGAPVKLELIGWGARTAAHAGNAPGQPRDLEAVTQGAGIVVLDWKSAASGGRVRNYLVERREERTGGGGLSAWHQAGVALKSEITLKDQPRGVQLEYRVIAMNTRGNSEPSNTAEVVL